MTYPRPPSWLMRDVIAWLRLSLSIWTAIALGVRAFARATGPRGRMMLHPDDLLAITTAFAEFEANLEWAIARQAMRLRGLSDDIRRHVPPRARTQGAWLRRLTRKVTRLRNMDKAARKLAWRMARAGRVARPLRLIASRSSTSPAYGEGGKQRAALSEFPPPVADWGRWIARSCAQDGGGRLHRATLATSY